MYFTILVDNYETMIKFFRKICRNLLSEGKTGKYLKYAIGEIVLVVIGILIALSLNEQKQKSDNSELLKLYTIQLVSDVENNITALINANKHTTRYINHIDSLETVLKNKDYDNPLLLAKSQYLFTTHRFSPIAVTYENLKFSGDLKLFDDLEIRKSIRETFHSFQSIARVEEIDNNGVYVCTFVSI